MNPIVGIGELLWDVFPDGHKVAGGAPFNFAFHCRQLGHDAVVVSRVGDDELGRELRAEVRRLGLSDEFIQTDPVHPTGTVRVTVDAAGLPSYEIVDDVAWDYIGEQEPIALPLCLNPAAVCFGTLALRRPVSRSSILQFVRPGPEMPSALRVFDANFRPPFVPSASTIRDCTMGADWIKVNESEWMALEGVFGGVLCTELAQWVRRLADRPDAVWIITCGENGVLLDHPVNEEGLSGDHVPVVPTQVVDTVGAGDSFTAAMVCLHLEGRPLRDCARFATHYAARVCEHRGATPSIDRAEVERLAFG